MSLVHWFGQRAIRREWLRGALGGMIAIALTALVCRYLSAGEPGLPWLIAPMGASAVLLFEVPASPFSQPWPVFGSHLISAAIGLELHHWLPAGALAVGLAVGLSIAVMSLLRCLHPPAGGTAALMCLSGITSWWFLVTPIAANAVLLLACAFAWHRLTGHTYPHHAASNRPPERYSMAQIEAVLADWDEVLDISGEDLAMLIRTLDERTR